MVFSATGWWACHKRLLSADTVVLLGDATYLSLQQMDHANICALEEDLNVRGIRGQCVVPVLDYNELVDLTTKHKPIVSWKG